MASAIVLALSGCASIFNGKSQSVVVNSVPEGASASITNRAGEKVYAGTTPVTLTLNRGAGYFKAETYTVNFAKEGFAPQQVTISGTLSGWYIGNLLLGGFVGMVIVDPLTGGMYTLPETVSAELQPQGQKTSGADATLTIVSSESLTAEQMRQARPLAARTQLN